MKIHKVLFDITYEVRATGWVLDKPDRVTSKLKDLLRSNKSLSAIFNKHVNERKDLLERKNLKLSVKYYRQLQGGLRFVVIYSFERE